MKKIIFLVFISMLAKWSYAQKDTISSEVDFKKFVYKCIDSFVEKEVKYSSILGIKMTLNLNGEINRYNHYNKQYLEHYQYDHYQILQLIPILHHHQNQLKKFHDF